VTSKSGANSRWGFAITTIAGTDTQLQPSLLLCVNNFQVSQIPAPAAWRSSRPAPDRTAVPDLSRITSFDPTA